MGTTITNYPRDVHIDEVCAMSPGWYSVTWGQLNQDLVHETQYAVLRKKTNPPNVCFIFLTDLGQANACEGLYEVAFFLLIFFCLSLSLFSCEIPGPRI